MGCCVLLFVFLKVVSVLGEDIVIYGPSIAQSLFDSLSEAYMINHDHAISYQSVTQERVPALLADGQPVILTSLNNVSLPPHSVPLPLFGFPFVIVFHLENVDELFISQAVLLDIVQGRITQWNHANLTILNPSISLPNESIGLIVGPLLDEFVEGFSVIAGGPIDRSFLSSNKTKTLENGVATTVKITPFSMGFSWMADALVTNSKLAFLENEDHLFAKPYNGVPSALNEYHVLQQQEQNALPYNLGGRLTWPLIGLVYVILPGQVEICEHLKVMREFASMMSQTTADRLAKVLGWEPITSAAMLNNSLGPSVNFDSSDVFDQISCPDERVHVFYMGTSTQLRASILKLLVAYSVDALSIFEVSLSDIITVLDAQLAGENNSYGVDVDISMTWGPLLSAYGDLIGTPVFMGALVPIVNLGQNTSITLSTPVLAQILTGTIKRWDDSQIQLLNPRVSLPPQHIVVFAGPKTHPDRPSALLEKVLGSFAPTASFSWASVNTSLPNTEDAVRLVQITPFSIGYTFAHTVEDLNLVPNMIGSSGNVLSFTPGRLSSCWISNEHANCWPLALPLVAVLRQPEGYGECATQKLGVDVISWILRQNKPIDKYMVPNPFGHSQSLGVIEYCKGRSLLFTYPEPQQLNDAARITVHVFCIIGMIWSVCQAIALGVARDNSNLKAASVLFSLLAVVGVFLMLITPLLIVNNDLTSAKCGSGVWLLTFGFSLTYGSLFAKLFRLYKIFTSRSLVVPRLGNKKLFLIVLGFLAIDFILLLIYNIVTPPEPGVVSARFQSEEDLVTGYRELTWRVCSFENSAVLQLLLVVKLAVALSGAGMAFFIRQVGRRFSATSALGGSFYNMFLTSIIVVIILIIFENPDDPTQELYVPVFAGLWISFITLLALTLDSNVLLACNDLSRPLRRLLNPSDSKDRSRKNTATTTATNGSHDSSEDGKRRSNTGPVFVVNRDMFPSKYELFEAELLEKILEELTFQRAAVRRALAASSGTSPPPTVELERPRVLTQIEVSPHKFGKSTFFHHDDHSHSRSPRESKIGDILVKSTSNDHPFKVVVIGPDQTAPVVLESSVPEAAPLAVSEPILESAASESILPQPATSILPESASESILPESVLEPASESGITPSLDATKAE